MIQIFYNNNKEGIQLSAFCIAICTLFLGTNFHLSDDRAVVAINYLKLYSLIIIILVLFYCIYLLLKFMTMFENRLSDNHGIKFDYTLVTFVFVVSVVFTFNLIFYTLHEYGYILYDLRFGYLLFLTFVLIKLSNYIKVKIMIQNSLSLVLKKIIILLLSLSPLIPLLFI